MSLMPNAFMNIKSFKDFSISSGVAWLLLLVIDVIFINGMQDEFDKLKCIWIVGLAISLCLAILRLFALDKEEKEKGDVFFVVLNAALIFLCASGFNGFTKELGGWTMIRENLEKKEQLAAEIKESTGNIFGVLLAWTPSLLANQTSIWPDIETIAKNNFLHEENITLRDSLRFTRITLPFDTAELKKENTRLQDSILRLKAEIQILEFTQTDQQDSRLESALRENNQLLADNKKLSNENKSLREEIEKLKDRIRKCELDDKCASIVTENELLNKQLKTLLARINAFNERQRIWDYPNNRYVKSVREQVNAAVKDEKFYDFLFLTPIDTKI